MVEVSPRTALLVVKKRSGQQVPFFETRIYNAIESAFKEYLNIPHEVALPPEDQENVKVVTQNVVRWCEDKVETQPILFIEDIQNTVVREIRESGFEKVADLYSNYRRSQELKRFETERISVEKRDGRVVAFKPEKIAIAIGKAFAAQNEGKLLSPLLRHKVLEIADEVVAKVKGEDDGTQLVQIEHIQDLVEKSLMDAGYHDIARAYIIYREAHRTAREVKQAEEAEVFHKIFNVKLADGTLEQFDVQKLRPRVAEACRGLEDKVSVDVILKKTLTNCYDGMESKQIPEAILLAVRPLVEEEPAYSYVAARILLSLLYREVVEKPVSIEQMRKEYPKALKHSFEQAVKAERLSPELLTFDLDKIGHALKAERDLQFNFMGLKTLYDRYFIHLDGRRIEAPQIFWMRVAMGLSIQEGPYKTDRAIEFYEVLSTFSFVSSTPTLFNSGTLRSQLSSCFWTTIGDDLDHIFECIKDNALLSKWSGGLGNDWTPVRGLGAHIQGTNGKSQGVVPFMKVANDTAVAVNQGGKRKGAVCAYLEVWHCDIEEFLELRKNTGDDRRRTHDMHTANWIPDLFMKRVKENRVWTLFSPDETPDLHDLYGKAFEERYHQYEEKAKTGGIKLFKEVSAVQLWRKMLQMLFETGHPWITFKDPSNVRSPQDHVGVVHSSNLCTEILLNTSPEETAVCNLGSINLAAHTTQAGIDEEKLAKTVKTAIRMLDNVIDINYYPTDEAHASNVKHRPIGLGLMGFTDALYIQGFSYASREAIEFSDQSMELISYHAILGSSQLAKERGVYASYKGSKWDRGILPIDSVVMLEEERGGHLDMDSFCRLDWAPVRESVKKYGMRNSNTMAIAPTATIANIIGVTQSIEPTYQHLYVKSNLMGEFTVANPYLVEELKALGLWDRQMIDDLKYFDGVLQEISRIPQSIKDRYPTAFELGSEWLIECASRRQKWIDMGESLNLYLAEASGKKLHQMYFMAWEKGLKTTYYLRSMGATRIEKSTVDVNQYGGNPLGRKVEKEEEAATAEPKACSLEDPDCEACQ